ncbi:hypothetical protein [Burkholderia sp. BCC1977]|uniref:hypothetical protein n=1 Tax=Burkholderia sp. BCC1977 TaxID=2817440 RepID=UPI002ABD61FF|nr:hypothetical protein [Burkholderia sp. BCC1977]
MTGSAAALAVADCAERWSGSGARSVDDEKAGASTGVADNVCAPAAPAMPAETMQTSDESGEEQFMTNRTE